MRAAVAHLRDALQGARTDGLRDSPSSRALTYMEVARGRPTETGVFGGLEGALANTVLGVPAGAPQQDACAAPKAAPVLWHAWRLPGLGGGAGERRHACAGRKPRRHRTDTSRCTCKMKII